MRACLCAGAGCGCGCGCALHCSVCTRSKVAFSRFFLSFHLCVAEGCCNTRGFSGSRKLAVLPEITDTHAHTSTHLGPSIRVQCMCVWLLSVHVRQSHGCGREVSLARLREPGPACHYGAGIGLSSAVCAKARSILVSDRLLLPLPLSGPTPSPLASCL